MISLEVPAQHLSFSVSIRYSSWAQDAVETIARSVTYTHARRYEQLRRIRVRWVLVAVGERVAENKDDRDLVPTKRKARFFLRTSGSAQRGRSESRSEAIVLCLQQLPKLPDLAPRFLRDAYSFKPWIRDN